VPFVGGKVGVQGDRKANVAPKCVHMYVNAQMRPIETAPGIGGRGTKEKGRG
jgi:hypothetical protein